MLPNIIMRKTHIEQVQITKIHILKNENFAKKKCLMRRKKLPTKKYNYVCQQLRQTLSHKHLCYTCAWRYQSSIFVITYYTVVFNCQLNIFSTDYITDDIIVLLLAILKIVFTSINTNDLD